MSTDLLKKKERYTPGPRIREWGRMITVSGSRLHIYYELRDWCFINTLSWKFTCWDGSGSLEFGPNSLEGLQTGGPDQAEIKRLQGIRKFWSKELASYDTPKAKIKNLKQMLAEAGMTGRYSQEKA